MLKNKPVLFFFLKLILIFTILAVPSSFSDSTYGKYYRSISKFFFKDYGKTGVVVFRETKDKSITHIDIGNRAQKHPNGAIDTATAEFSTRYRGYIPTILFLSLVLASPISWKRRILASVVGLGVMTLVVMLKQSIHLKYMCTQAQWLKLYDFTDADEKRISFLYFNLANYSGPSLIFTIALWILLSFRKKDMELFLK